MCQEPEAPLCGRLLGFASLDASGLCELSEPICKAFLPDLRLLEAPGASASLELDVRVWPRPLAAPVAEKEKVLLEQEAKDFRRESRHAFQAVKPLKGH